MNKRMVMLVVFLVVNMYAMEINKINSWSIAVGTTRINLIKGFIGDAGDRVDAIVVGKNQQQRLRKPKFCDTQEVGKINSMEKHIYRKSEDDESASDDDTYKPYEFVKYFDEDEKTKIWNRTTTAEVKADVVQIIEPRMSACTLWEQNETGDPLFYYRVHRKHPAEENEFQILEFCGDQAIAEARNDLKILCYKQILEYLRDKKSIAIAALSTEVGLPRKYATPIAIDAILEFISHNPEAYDVIELFVNKRSEFVLYKQLLTERKETLSEVEELLECVGVWS